MTVDNAPHRTSRARRRGAVQSYDFNAPPGLSREHTRLLEVAFETFARQWTTQLGSRLRVQAHVTLAGVVQQSYDAYVAALAAHNALVVFSTEHNGTGILQLAPASAFAHLDHALGGPGGEQPVRPLSDIEVSVTTGMCERALSTLGYAFAAVMPIEPRIEGLQQDPQLAQAARANDMVVVATFELRIGAVTEPATLLLPLAPILNRLDAQAQKDVRTAEELRSAQEASRVLAAAVPEVPVDVAVRMAPLPAPPEHVLHLAVGDLLRLPHAADRPLELVAEDVVVARAVTTTRGNRRACLIVSHEEDPR